MTIVKYRCWLNSANYFHLWLRRNKKFKIFSGWIRFKFFLINFITLSYKSRMKSSMVKSLKSCIILVEKLELTSIFKWKNIDRNETVLIFVWLMNVTIHMHENIMTSPSPSWSSRVPSPSQPSLQVVLPGTLSVSALWCTSPRCRRRCARWTECRRCADVQRLQSVCCQLHLPRRSDTPIWKL